MLCAFDFDGTLADSKAVYYKAIKIYAQSNGFKVPLQSEMDFVNPGLFFDDSNPPIVFEGWGELEHFKAHLDKVYLITDSLICGKPSDMPLFEGVRDLLEDLYCNGFTLSIVTSRALEPILALIEHHKISPFFKSIRSAQDLIDRGYRGKPYPDKLNCVLKEMACPADNCIMIGDTLMDMVMAKSAGVKAIGVSWGYHDEVILRKHGADEVVSTPEMLNQVIRSFTKEEVLESYD